jgi:hypothetical protein
MAGSPRYKIIDRNGVYQASTKSVAAAVYLLDGCYPAGKIRDGNWNRVLYKHDGIFGLDLSTAIADCRAKQDEWSEAARAKWEQREREAARWRAQYEQRKGG